MFQLLTSLLTTSYMSTYSYATWIASVLEVYIVFIQQGTFFAEFSQSKLLTLSIITFRMRSVARHSRPLPPSNLMQMWGAWRSFEEVVRSSLFACNHPNAFPFTDHIFHFLLNPWTIWQQRLSTPDSSSSNFRYSFLLVCPSEKRSRLSVDNFILYHRSGSCLHRLWTSQSGFPLPRPNVRQIVLVIFLRFVQCLHTKVVAVYHFRPPYRFGLS